MFSWLPYLSLIEAMQDDFADEIPPENIIISNGNDRSLNTISNICKKYGSDSYGNTLANKSSGCSDLSLAEVLSRNFGSNITQETRGKPEYINSGGFLNQQENMDNESSLLSNSFKCKPKSFSQPVFCNSTSALGRPHYFPKLRQQPNKRSANIDQSDTQYITSGSGLDQNNSLTYSLPYCNSQQYQLSLQGKCYQNQSNLQPQQQQQTPNLNRNSGIQYFYPPSNQVSQTQFQNSVSQPFQVTSPIQTNSILTVPSNTTPNTIPSAQKCIPGSNCQIAQQPPMNKLIPVNIINNDSRIKSKSRKNKK